MQELRRTREQRDQALREKQHLENEIARLREENGRLQKELETAQRAARRQAAPFSRGKRKNQPKSPGRKAGKAYSKHHRRPIPDHVDEQIPEPVPEKCPQCRGVLTVERIAPPYQEEIVRRTWIRRFDIPICRCAQCGKRVQGRHPLQTSDAIGAAAVQVGPEALTLGVLMNKAQGLPHADAAAILKQRFRLAMSLVIRKNWGGNRTKNGARAQAVLTRILLTARQRDKDVFELLTDLLRSPRPKLLDILPEVEAVTGSNGVDAVATGGRTVAGRPAGDGLAEMRLPAGADVSVFAGLAALRRNSTPLQFGLRSVRLP